MTVSAVLALENGELFYGISAGAAGQAVGEVLFNTSITGYQEILTDPSYCRKIITLTHPHIGNVGVNEEDQESGGIYAHGLVTRDMSLQSSNWRAQGDLLSYLSKNNVVTITEVDTRRLTRILRTGGVQRGCIIAGEKLDPDAAVSAARAFPSFLNVDLAKEVSTSNVYQWQQDSPVFGQDCNKRSAQWRVIVYDFGVKRSILRLLTRQGCVLTVVPATTKASWVLAENPDGVFLSNGPGDPASCDYAIAAIRKIAEQQIPIFGVCLGHQLLALAFGAKTSKLKFGHHGANHPVQELATGRVFITSQNHDFAVVASSVPPAMHITHRSLFDDSVQGVQHKTLPAFGFQGHPEAGPGPNDIADLFTRFIKAMQTRAIHA